VVRWLFVAYAASLPFEAMDLGFASSSLSLAKISGLLFIAAYLFYHNALTGKRKAPGVSAPLAFFILYLAVYAAHGLFLDPRDFPQFLSIFMTLAQLLLVFWIAADLLRQAQMARAVLITFALAAAFSAAASVLGVPGFSSAIESRIGERVTALEFNPNYLAFTMALAALTLIHGALSVRKSWQAGLMLAAVLPLLATMVRTASRAGFAAFGIGLLTYVLCSRQARQRWMAAALGLMVVVAALIFFVRQDSVVLTRFEQSYEGNLAGRQKILPASLQMFLERPLTGWGPVRLWWELSRRIGEIWGTKDAHNLYLHLLLEVGVIGAAPFFVGLYLCARAAWRARNGEFGYLPLALMAAMLSANIAHTYLARKPQWLFLAFLVASGAVAEARRGLPRQPSNNSRFKSSRSDVAVPELLPSA
jgi:O-antigen ligase